MYLVAEPRWLQLVSPATACLRFGVLLTIAGSSLFGFKTDPAVSFAAIGIGLIYAGMYVTAALGKMRPAPLAYAVIADGVLIGILLTGAAVSMRGPVALLLSPCLLRLR